MEAVHGLPAKPISAIVRLAPISGTSDFPDSVATDVIDYASELPRASRNIPRSQAQAPEFEEMFGRYERDETMLGWRKSQVNVCFCEPLC